MRLCNRWPFNAKRTLWTSMVVMLAFFVFTSQLHRITDLTSLLSRFLSGDMQRTVQQPPRALHPCARANLTMVSAFFDIGDHRKGSAYRRITAYLRYSRALAFIHTPLVFYTDSEMFAEHLTKLRSRLDPRLTRIISIRRESLWSFNLRDTIANLYAQKGYPKHAPNTVVPEYSCAQHSKYACVLDLILKRPEVPRTDVYAWMDFGYFRNLQNGKDYCLVLPKGFNRTKASFNQVHRPNFACSARKIFYDNRVWLGGGMFVASRDTMITLCTEYQRAAEFWLFKRNLSSTDQQTIYASFTEEGRRDVDFGVEMQTEPGGHDWFDLGNSCLYPLDHTSSTRSHRTTTLQTTPVHWRHRFIEDDSSLT